MTDISYITISNLH